MINDEKKPIVYTCPVCEQDKEAIYSYPEGAPFKISDTVKLTGMCFKCLRNENPHYARTVRKAEQDLRAHNISESQKRRSRG